jgi:hypothetical protein
MLIWDKYVKINNIPYLYPVGISGWKIYPHNIVHRLGQSLWLVICTFLLSWRAIYVLRLYTGSNWVHTNWTATLHLKYSLQVILLLWVKIFEVQAQIEFGTSSLLHFMYSFPYNFNYSPMIAWDGPMLQHLLRPLRVSIRARVAFLPRKEMSKEKFLTWLPWQLGIK